MMNEKIYKLIVKIAGVPIENDKAFLYINRLVKEGLYEAVLDDEGEVVGVAMFYYTDEPLLQSDVGWELPEEDLKKGRNAFISILYAVDDATLRGLKRRLIKRLSHRENLDAAYWYNHKVPYTLLKNTNRKEEKMIRENCGLKAVSHLLSGHGVNGNSTVSLHTLQNISMDNNIRAYAVEIIDEKNVKTPYIAYKDDHFYLSDTPETKYGLVTELTPGVRRLKHREAISIKGRKGGGIKGFIGPVLTGLSMVIPGAQVLTPYLTAASTGYGAYQGYKSGGTAGALLGGLQGYGGASLGAGLGGGISGGFSGMSAGTGFMSGAKAGFSSGVRGASLGNIFKPASSGLSLTPTQATGATGADTFGVSYAPDTASFASGVSNVGAPPGFYAGVDLSGASLANISSLTNGAGYLEEPSLAGVSSGAGASGATANSADAALGYTGLDTSGTSSLWGEITKPFGKSGMSLASLALRGMSAIPATTYPTQEGMGIYSETARKLMGGKAITEAGQAAQNQLTNMVNGEGFTEADRKLYEASSQRIDLNTQNRLDQMKNYYARYNALDSGEYRDAVRKTLEEADLQKAQLLGEIQVTAVNRRMQALSAATGYEAHTLNALFQAAQSINYGEELRAMIKNNDMDNLRRSLNTLALAMEGGGQIQDPNQYDPKLIQIIQELQGGA